MRASSSDRTINCPASVVQQQHELPVRKKTDDANQLGTLCHHWVETGETRLNGIAAEHIATLKKKLVLSGMEDQRQRWWPPETGTHEYTFAFNPFTLVLVVFRGKRDKADAWKKGKRWDPRTWVTGTIDWLGRRNDRWHVDDLKTGAWPVEVDGNKQLLSYAIVPWLLDGALDEWWCDVSITSWPKYPLAGEPKRSWSAFTALHLMEHLQDLRWALRSPTTVLPVSYGPPQKDENGNYEFGGKMANCAGCGAREPFPASAWMTNFWFRTLPHCTAGMLKRLSAAMKDTNV